MMLRIGSALAAASLIALVAGCNTAPTATPPSEADAAKIVDTTVQTWQSMDAAKIKALYAANVAGYDPLAPGLAKDSASWGKFQDDFAAAKIDKLVEKARLIQVLDADTFVASGSWDATSTATPANAMSWRCTDTYQKQADGAWLIANEHCSAVPKG